MRKYYYTMLALFVFSFFVRGQEWKNLDTEINDPTILINSVFRIIKPNKYIQFLKEPKTYNYKILEYVKKGAVETSSDFNIYKGLEFRVINVVSVTTTIADKNYITDYLEVTDLKTSKKSFIKFDKYNVKQYFEFKDFVLPTSYLCSLIKLNVDKYTKDSLYYFNEVAYGYELSKNKLKNTFTLNLAVPSETLDINAQNLVILFTDGTVKNYNGKAKVEVGTTRYIYSFSVILNSDDIELFTTKTIDSFKIGSFDREGFPLQRTLLSSIISCFLEL